jgi:phage shock protein A
LESVFKRVSQSVFSLVQVLASQKQLEQRYKQAQSNADDWLRRAKLALQKGQEELAREALKKKKDYEDNANALKAQLDAQKGVVDKLISNTRLLESKISEAKSKKDTLKARAQSAKTSQKVQEMLGNINTSSAMAAFEKMEEKVMALEAESDAVAQLGTDDLSAKFALLESSDVDDDLDKLKREMSGIGSQTRAALPGGQSTSGKGQSTPGKTSVKDLEIEAELNELRKKASDL